MKFYNWLNEIKTNEVEKWKKDIRKLHKIYKDIDSEEKMKESHKIFITMSDNFDKWVYKYLLKNDKKTYLQEQVRTLGWDMYIYLSSNYYFKTKYDYNTGKHILDLNYILKNRQKIINKGNIIYRKFFKIVEEYYNSEFKSFKNSNDVVNKFGINFIIYDKMKDNKKTKEYLEYILPEQIKLLNKKGFKKAYKNLNVHIKYSLKEDGVNSLAGGYYDRDADKIALSMLGLDEEAFVHELGHRIYFKLPNTSKSVWEETLSDLTDFITEKDFNLFWDKYLYKLENDINSGENNISEINIYEDDELLKYKFTFMKEKLQKIKFYSWENKNFNIKEKLGGFVLNERLHLGFKISHYATKNPWEGFAEAFAYYILKSNKLNQFIKNILFDTLRAGNWSINESNNITNCLNEIGFTKYPKGWTRKSVTKFVNTLSKKFGLNPTDKGWYNKCVLEMKDEMGEGANGFCASIKDEYFGQTKWRSGEYTVKDKKDD